MKRITLLIVGSLFLSLIVFAPIHRSASAAKNREKFRQQELVVKLKPGANIQSIIARYGASTVENIRGTRKYRIGWTSGQAIEQKLSQMVMDSDLLVASRNYIVQSPEILQSTAAFVDQSTAAFVDGVSPVSFFDQPQVVNLHLAEAQSYTLGGGVTVAVIDTGIDATHPLFAGRLTANGYDFVDDDANPSEVSGGAGYGHGTFVSGLISLAAPNALIMPLRAFGADGSATSFDIARAIDYARENGARVINMSFGMLEQDLLVNDAINDAVSSVYMVAAAGNDSAGSLHWPAALYNWTFAVASVASDDTKASFSNYHSNVRGSAPGVSVYSAYPGNRWGTWSGTSFSTAFVTGEAALLLSLNPGLTRTQLNTFIGDSGVDINPVNPSYTSKLGKRIDYRAAIDDLLGNP
jgi:subtilisin family serine protease